MSNYRIKIDEESFDLNIEALENFDMIPNGTNAFHLLQNNQTHQVKILQIDFNLTNSSE